MWIICLIIAVIVVIFVNNWIQLNILYYRLKFPDLGPSALIDKLLVEMDAFLTLDDEVVHKDNHFKALKGRKVKVIKKIIEQEGIDHDEY